MTPPSMLNFLASRTSAVGLLIRQEPLNPVNPHDYSHDDTIVGSMPSKSICTES